MTISEKLLEILVCPSCKSKLTSKDNSLVCKECNKEYEVKDDIPKFIE